MNYPHDDSSSTTLSRGSNSSHDDAPFLQRSLQHLHDALSLMDANDTKEYTTARQVAPHLFQEEVDPLKFLRTWESLSLYWKYRKEYFGDRWLLPLSQSPVYGALWSPLDVQLLQSGYAVDYGEYVLIDYLRLTDFAGAHPEYSDEELERARVRILFYGTTVTSTQQAQRVGKKFLVMLEGVTKGRIWSIKKQIWPCKFAQVYIVQRTARFQDAVKQYWLNFFLHALETYFHIQSAPKLIFAASREEILIKILQVGFPLDFVPTHLGGPWSYQTQVNEWVEWLARGDEERNRRVLLEEESVSLLPSSPASSQSHSRRRIQSPQITKQIVPLQTVDYRIQNVKL